MSQVAIILFTGYNYSITNQQYYFCYPELKNLKGENMIKKLGQRIVTTGMNLDGSANQRLSRMLQNKAQFAAKDTTMDERIASYMAAKQQYMPVNAKVAEEIIPENSINYIA